MGRTNATYRNHLDNFINGFKPFRKALRKENKEYLDMLWEKAHRYSSAAAYMNSSKPGLPAMMSIMLGLQRQVEEVKQRLEELEQEIDKCSK